MTSVELLTDSGIVTEPSEGTEGFGCLATERGNLPLESIDVHAAITGLATGIEVTQGFQNPYDEPLEATYIFPLPPRAAVTALRMEADGRVVQGVLKERGEARADYDQAVAAGQRASIAEEERSGVFTMRVGNIMPGERVTSYLTLATALSYEDGEATFRFPLVVAPRYVPGTPLDGGQVGTGTAPDTDAAPDASRISPPVLLPGFPNPIRLGITVDVDPAGLPLTGLASSLYATVTEETAAGTRVEISQGERADRDFILRLRYGADAVTTSLAVLSDEDGGTFALTVLPPTDAPPVAPRDVVLVLDRSGSMHGWKMVAARRAAGRIVDTLGSTDRFAVLGFDDRVDTPQAGLVAADDRNRFRAVEFLAGLTARGGTEMLTPLRRAATLLGESGGDGGPRERVLVLVTDGQVSNEDQLLSELAGPLAVVRVHTVGIDRAVNEGFLRRLSGSSGRCELVESEDRLDEAMQHIHRRIGTPLVTDLRLKAKGLAVDADTFSPTPLPDLYAGVPAVVYGRFVGSAGGDVRVSGSGEFQAKITASPSDNKSLGALWARARVRDLEDRYVTGGRAATAELEQQIVATSLRHGVLSRFTAFVAVDQRVVNEGGSTRTVTQPVDTPSGWEQPSMPQAARGAMPMYGSAAPAGFAGGFGGAQQGGYGGAPASYDMGAPADYGQAGYGSAPAPQPGSSFGADQQGQLPSFEAAPQRPVVPPPTNAPAPAGQTIAAFVAVELQRLRAADTDAAWERASHLTALAERIRVLLDAWRRQGEPGKARTALGRLATEAAGHAGDDAEVDRRWQLAITTLESLAGAQAKPSRRSFWKR